MIEMINDEKKVSGLASTLHDTDPEFADRFDHFVLQDVIPHNTLDEKTRFMAILAMLMGCQGLDEFRVLLSVGLDESITVIEVKEIIYQSVAYLGLGRSLPFLNAMNAILTRRGIEMPLVGQATTTPETRLEAGIQAQVDIFGEDMKDFWKSGALETRHINQWLAANCFGDYYTRTGLSLKQREMITFCFLLAQGGCEPQLTSHAAANMRLGNDANFLRQIVSQGFPYIGYPRSLNALRCVNDAMAKKGE